MKNNLGFTLEEQETINRVVREYGLTDYSKHLNKVCFFGNESRRHFLAKANLCYNLKKEKIPFITEFGISGKKGKENIPDILVLKPLVALEVLESESPETFTNKVHKAANGLFFVPITAERGMFLNDIHELL